MTGIGRERQSLKACGKNRTYSAHLRNFLDGGVARETLLSALYGALKGKFRDDLGGPQGIKALQNDSERKNGTGNEGPNGPSCGLYDADQNRTFYF